MEGQQKRRYQQSQLHSKCWDCVRAITAWSSSIAKEWCVKLLKLMRNNSCKTSCSNIWQNSEPNDLNSNSFNQNLFFTPSKVSCRAVKSKVGKGSWLARGSACRDTSVIREVFMELVWPFDGVFSITLSTYWDFFMLAPLIWKGDPCLFLLWLAWYFLLTDYRSAFTIICLSSRMIICGLVIEHGKESLEAFSGVRLSMRAWEDRSSDLKRLYCPTKVLRSSLKKSSCLGEGFRS